MSIKMPMFLIGFMGAGKTSVGEKLSEICGCAVMDTDQEIESKTGMAIPQIFEQYGEEYFRKLESEVLQELSQSSAVITTGGGIIVKEENRKQLKEETTIFLQAHPQTVIERIGGDPNRPLLQNKNLEEVTSLYQSRLPYYLECATSVIDTTYMSIEQVAQKIYNQMNV